jgi:hypothetical protein
MCRICSLEEDCFNGLVESESLSKLLQISQKEANILAWSALRLTLSINNKTVTEPGQSREQKGYSVIGVLCEWLPCEVGKRCGVSAQSELKF